MSGASGRDRDAGFSKLVLKGTVEQRLTQLDHRETELLDEIQRLKLTIKRLREERGKKHDEYASVCLLRFVDLFLCRERKMKPHMRR